MNVSPKITAAMTVGFVAMILLLGCATSQKNDQPPGDYPSWISTMGVSAASGEDEVVKYASGVDEEAALQHKFTEWDQLQQQHPDPHEAQEEKKAVLRSMQEILSNRTYVKNMVNDLMETIA